jgi:hypothetical protein
MTDKPPADPARESLFAALMDAHNPDKPHRRPKDARRA